MKFNPEALYKKLVPLFFISLFFTNGVALAQSIVNVNPLTGAANVVIPIYTVNSGQVSVPISLSYSGSGVKTRDVEGTAGMGWNVNAGGQISRTVRGLPDDCTADSMGHSRLGWMSTGNTGASYASSYTIQNNGSTCSYGVNDVNNINTNIPSTDDTEPDLFYISAPGLSCEMVYDRKSTPAAFHPVNYRDMIISYTTVGGSGHNPNEIASFTITNDKGITYVFAKPESVTQTTTLNGGAEPNYFLTKYNQYQSGITYSDAWNLTSITDANGNGVTFTYTAALVRNSIDPVELYFGGSTTATLEYFVQQSVSPQVLSSIAVKNAVSSTTWLYFTWNPAQEIVQTGQTVIESITGMGRDFQFTYNNVISASHGSGYTRAFLTSFSDIGCGTPISYQFGYVGVNTTNNTTALGDSTSNQVDYWGYFSSEASTTTMLPSVYVNPSTSSYPRYVIAAGGSPGSAYPYSLLASNDRLVSSSTVADGALNTITYASGGSSTIIYAPNDYYDVPSGATIQGGGIRVSQIVDAVGSGATNNITRNYSYVIPSGLTNAGYSSGEPITLPQFAFTMAGNNTGSGQALWTNATVLSAYDLSNDDHTIMYAYTSVSETNTAGTSLAGSTLYNYAVPATYWNASATPVCSGCTTPEWYPTVNYISGYNCTANYGPIANLTYSYPFIPNPNYDFERGLPIKITNFNNSGAEVSETDYTYVRTYAPTAITAFKSDDVPSGSGKSYNKYTVFYNTSELTASVTKKVYDASTASQAQTSTVNYTYGSANHKLLTQEAATNSDNSTVTTHITYTKDLTTATNGTGNPNVQAIYNMQQPNMNINIPVETYRQVTASGGGATTTGASLTLFRDTTISSVNHVIPSQQWKWVQPSGNSFTPLSISGATLTKDANYFIAGNYDIYDNTGFARTADDGYKHIETTILDHFSNRPTAVFKNAAYNQIAFSDFDTDPTSPPSCSFAISGTEAFVPTSSHAGNAYGLGTGQTLSQTVVKNGLAQNYIFSIWINAANSGTFSVTLNGGTPYPINYTGTGSGSTTWTYYELKMPLTGLTSPLTINCTTSQQIAIDDVLLYPDVSEASTVTYDAAAHYKIAQTNTNGVSEYFTNDQWGRVLYAFDQDKNILLRKQYVSAANFQTFLAPTITGPAAVYNGISATFTNITPNYCLTDGMTYTWNFGDGSTPVVSSSNSLSHTYTANGPYTITVTVASPLLGSKTGTLNITVANLPSVALHYENTCTPGGHIPSAIATVNFIQGSTTVYSFSTSQLVSGVTVVPGTYTIQIIPVGTQYNSVSNPTGYAAVNYPGATSQCWNYTGSSFSITDNISYTPNIYFQIQPIACD